jgi:hypothetical protein
VYESPGSGVLFQKTYDVEPSLSTWTLPFTAPVGATIRIVVELMSVTSGVDKVEYSGQAGPLTMSECTSDCSPIPIKAYPGPVENLGAISVVVTPASKTVTEGDNFQLHADASPANASYVPVWRSLNPAVATVGATGMISAVAAGTTGIIVSLGPRSDTASITVEAKAGCIEQSYSIGTTVQASWDVTDCLAASGSGRHYDMYRFTLTQQTTFRAAITGPAGRRISTRRAGTQSYIQLMGLEEFMPSSSNPLEVNFVLAPGSYVFEIATPDAATLGPYALSTTVVTTTPCMPMVFATPGVIITDQIDSGSCIGPNGGREDRYIVMPDVGVRLDLSLNTPTFAPVLTYRDDRQGPASPTLAFDLQNTVGASARLGYTTTFGSWNEVLVSSANGAISGTYTLAIGTASTTDTCTPINTTVGGKRLAVWDATDCAAGGRLYDGYPFTIASQTAFAGTLTSTVGNTSFGIFANGAEVLDWQRTASGDLNATWFLAPGSYELRAGAPAPSAGTSYSYVTSSSSSNIGCSNNGATGGVTFANQVLGGNDCTFNGRFEDRVILYVAAGKEIEVTMNGSNFAPSAIIRDPASTPGTFLVLNRRGDAGSVISTWRTQTTGYYQIIFSSDVPGASGSYSGAIIVK